MTPQNAALDSLRTLSTSLTSVSIFSVCCYSSVSISVIRTPEVRTLLLGQGCVPMVPMYNFSGFSWVRKKMLCTKKPKGSNWLYFVTKSQGLQSFTPKNKNKYRIQLYNTCCCYITDYSALVPLLANIQAEPPSNSSERSKNKTEQEESHYNRVSSRDGGDKRKYS